MQDSTTIGKNIKRLRDFKDIYQDELAMALGVTQKAVSAWENGKACPRMGAMEQMATIFGCTMHEIIDQEANAIWLRNQRSWKNTPVNEDLTSFLIPGQFPTTHSEENYEQKPTSNYIKPEPQEEYTEEEKEIIQLYRTLSPDHQDDIYRRIMQLKIEERSERRGNKV